MNRKHLQGYVLHAAFVSMLLAGWLYNVDGARNVVQFFIWAILLPVGLVGIWSDDFAKNIAKDPEPKWPLAWASRLLNWACLGLLIWTGSWATGLALGIFMLAGAVVRNRVAEIRKAAT